MTVVRKIALLLGLLLLTGGSAGCWDKTEVNNLAIVLASGYDLAPDGQVMLTAQIARPGNISGMTGGGGPNPTETVVIVGGKGKSIFNAVKETDLKIPRTYYFGHNRVTVFQERLARSPEFAHVLESLTRQRLIRRTREIFVTKTPAKDIIQTLPFLEKVPAEDISKLVTAESSLNTVPQISIHKFMNRLYPPDIEPVVGGLELVQNVEDSAKQRKIIGVSGLGAFKGTRLVGWLDMNETTNFLLLRGETKTTLFSVPYQKGQLISYTLSEIKSQIKPRLVNGRPDFQVVLRLKAVITELEIPINLDESGNVSKLTERLNSELEKTLQKTIRKVQTEYGSDIFGFGQRLHRKYPRAWKQLAAHWDEEFAKARITVKVQTEIRDSEMVVNSFKR